MRTRLNTAVRFTALFLGLTLASCTERIDIELDSTFRRLAVYGTVTTDSVRHSVELTTSSDYFSNMPPPPVSNAVVELQFEGKTIRMEEQDTLPGVYRAPAAFHGIPGVSYTLLISEVDVDGDGVLEQYSAESTMPDLPRLDSIGLNYFRSPFVTGYQVVMFGQDSPEREWYRFTLRKNRVLLTDQLEDITVQPDDLFNGSYIFGLPVGFLLEDEPDESPQPGDTVTFELSGTDQAYYQFVVDAQLELFGNNPLFSGPPANVRSNISNQGKGIFSAISISRASAIVPVQ